MNTKSKIVSFYEYVNPKENYEFKETNEQWLQRMKYFAGSLDRNNNQTQKPKG